MLHMLQAAVSSPWAYLVLFTIALLDGFFPVVPAETMVITAGVFAAAGEPALTMVIAVALAGVLPWLLGQYARLRAEVAESGWRRAEQLERERRLAVRGRHGGRHRDLP